MFRSTKSIGKRVATDSPHGIPMRLAPWRLQVEERRLARAGSGRAGRVRYRVLGPYISPFLLGRILLALAVVLPPAGAMALNASEFREANPWQLVFQYFWCCETLLAVFLNF